MVYTRPYPGGFKDFPDTSTPISAAVLNTMDVGIRDIDLSLTTTNGRIDSIVDGSLPSVDVEAAQAAAALAMSAADAARISAAAAQQAASSIGSGGSNGAVTGVIRTSQVPELAAIAGKLLPDGSYVAPTVDCHGLLYALFDQYLTVIVDNDLIHKNAAQLDVAGKKIELFWISKTGRLRKEGAGGKITGQGMHQFMEVIPGAIPTKGIRDIPVADSTLYQRGDWVHVLSNTQFLPYLTTYIGALRQVTTVKPGLIVLSESIHELLPMVRGRNALRYVKTSGTYPAGSDVPMRDWTPLTVAQPTKPSAASEANQPKTDGTVYTMIKAYNSPANERPDLGQTAARVNNLTISNVNDTDGSTSLRFNQAVTVQAGDYLIQQSRFTTTQPNYMAGPWIEKVQPLSGIEIRVDGSWTGPGYFSTDTDNPNVTNPLSYQPDAFINFTYAKGVQITGTGRIGYNPVTAISMTNCIDTILENITIEYIWDTAQDPGANGAGAGYGLTENASNIRTSATNVKFIRCRHGRTTNSGGNAIYKWDALIMEKPRNTTGSIVNIGNMGAIGNVEHARFINCRAINTNNMGFDSHRTGYDDRFIGCTTTDCGGGFSARSDATVWINCLADGIDSSYGFVAQNEGVVGPTAYGCTVRGTTGTGALVWGYSINNNSVWYDCRYEGKGSGSVSSVAAVNQGSKAGMGTAIFYNFFAQNCDYMFNFAGGDTRSYNTQVGSGVGAVIRTTSAASGFDNKVYLPALGTLAT